MQSNSLVALSAVLIAGSRSLAESSTSSSEVIIPRASPGSKDSVLRIPSGRFIEIEGYTIGDEHRSEMSSKQFFDSIDKDKDGKLGHPELSQYLMNHIGGSNLDTTEEADEEAKSIMDRLDHNQDDELDSKDMYRFWEGLESLLTVDEVAEWIEHSLQLPPKIAQYVTCRELVAILKWSCTSFTPWHRSTLELPQYSHLVNPIPLRMGA
mmetsp:Transcript_11205/g.12422  ORF Transcript_11205/g.12422 Transcript_11205/m.12422 type:complete len:209 (-) Transcript_11205:338-964(-)